MVCLFIRRVNESITQKSSNPSHYYGENCIDDEEDLIPIGRSLTQREWERETETDSQTDSQNGE